MLNNVKRFIRQSPARPVYLTLSSLYRAIRRLSIYPSSASVGPVNYDAYWDEKFASQRGRMSIWRLRRAQAFAELVHPGDFILDLGVGDGALLKYLIEKRNVTGYGLDVSPKAVEFCRNQGLQVDLADVNQPISDFVHQPVDYIVLSEIIEHIPEPETLLERLRPLARKGIIVSIPNTGFIMHRLRLLFGKFPLQWMVTPGEHLRFWTRTDFQWWVKQIRFRIVREIPYEGTPWLRRALPGLFAAGIIYLLESSS